MIHWVRRMRAFWAGLWARLFRRVRVDYIGSAVPLPPPLKPEEERALVEAIEAGDSSAKGTLIEHNLRLVVYIARKFENTGIGMEDLISTGTIGLIKAVNTFDGSKKIKLATYASRCIENEILMHLRKTSRMRYEVSIDEPLNVDWDGNELLLSDILGTEPDIVAKPLEEETDKQILRDAVVQLPPRDKRIIELRFGLSTGEECTQKQVADQLGISQSYISRLEKRILSHLKKEMAQIL